MIAAVETKTGLAADPAFPRRDEFLNANALGERLAVIFRSAVFDTEITRIKYRPRKSLRISLSARIGGRKEVFSARMFPAGRAASSVATAAAVIPEFDAAVWRFPFDRKIASLPFGGNRELVAYAPEKCATFRCLDDADEVFAYEKIFADRADGERIFAIYESLSKNDLGELLPKAIAFSAENATLTVEAVKGTRLAELENGDQIDAHKLFGAAVARLHSVGVSNEIPPFLRHDREKIIATVQIIAETLPHQLAAAKRLAAKLIDASEAPATTVVLHGDVHTKNVILRENQTATLIDLDQTSCGRAESDIGSFLAGLYYREIIGEIAATERVALAANFLSGYAASRELPSDEELRIATATALFTERAARAISRVRRAGLQNFDRILAVADAFAGGSK